MTNNNKVFIDALQKILTEVDGAGLKNIAVDNKLHMAIYNTKHLAEAALASYADAPPSDPNEHPDQAIFDQYSEIKKKIGELGYMAFISSKEVEEYREWLRNDKYKHRLEWFEKEYPNGLYSKDEDGNLFGINILTKKFLVEADAAWEGTVTGKSTGNLQHEITDQQAQIIADNILDTCQCDSWESCRNKITKEEVLACLSDNNLVTGKSAGEQLLQKVKDALCKQLLSENPDQKKLVIGRRSFTGRQLHDEIVNGTQVGEDMICKVINLALHVASKNESGEAGKQPEQQPAVEKEGGKK